MPKLTNEIHSLLLWGLVMLSSIAAFIKLSKVNLYTSYCKPELIVFLEFVSVSICSGEHLQIFLKATKVSFNL